MKIRIRMQKRISLKNLLMDVAVICIFSFALLEHASISIPVFSQVKMPLLFIGGLCLLTQFGFFVKNLMKKKYFYVLSVLFLLCVFLLMSAYFNKSPEIGVSPVRTTVRLILYLMELFFLMVWVSETGRSQYVLDFLFRYVLVLTIATDILLFTRFIVFSDGHFETYLVGTKFSVSYFHMNLLTLWFIRNKERFYSDWKAKRIIIVGMPIVVLVSLHVDCMTGVLGCLVLLILFLLLNTTVQKKIMQLNSPVLLVLGLAVSVVFPFVSEQVMAIPFVSHVVENILGRDSTLTGRLNIFEAFSNEMRGHWLWGYGYGNGNAVSVTLFGYANSQNALLQWILQAGVPVVILLVLLMVLIFQQISKSSNQMRSMPFVVLIYVYIVVGTIETTFSMSFLMWIALIFMLVNEKENSVKSVYKISNGK